MRRVEDRFSGHTAVMALALVLIAIVAAQGCSKTRSDAAIQTDIQSRFYSDEGLKATNVQVLVDRSQVTLTGHVPTAEMRDRAVKIAGATSGVKLVEDRITLAQSAPAPTEATAEQATPARETPKPIRAKPKRKTRTAREYKPAPKPKALSTEPAPARPEGVPVETQQPTETANETTAPTQPVVQEAPPPQPETVTIPAGTHVSVRTTQAIDSSKDKAGQVFRASLDAPIFVNGQAVVPAGADVSIRLAVAKAAGRMTGTSELELQLVKLVAWGRSYPLTSNVYAATGKSRGKDTAKKVGVGAAVGAIIGAIAGGGKGAAIGAATGAGAGTAVQLATRGQQVKAPSETLLDFELQQPVTVTLPPPQP